MNLNAFKSEVQKLGLICIDNEPMKKHTSFAVGGPAELFIEADNCDRLPELIVMAKSAEIPLTVIGRGSNLLVSDKGIDGAVIHICDERISVCHNEIVCFAGARLSALCAKARESSLGGIEFAWGIPGSVGGAVYMNAGAYGGEMKQVLVSCRSVNSDGEITERQADELGLGYRTSIFKTNGEIILSATVSLKKRSLADIKADMDDYMNRRRMKQPLEFPSAGSTFKRPEGHFAGGLIEQCGLKGYSIGGAKVSEKHAGFVINSGDATCADILRLIEHIEKTVYRKTGIMLEPEVIFKGRK